MLAVASHHKMREFVLLLFFVFYCAFSVDPPSLNCGLHDASNLENEARFLSHGKFNKKSKYGHRKNCKWTFELGLNCEQIQIWCEYMSTSSDKKCKKGDVLTLEGISIDENSKIKKSKYCQKKMPSRANPALFTSSVTAIWKTDKKRKNKGFDCRVMCGKFMPRSCIAKEGPGKGKACLFPFYWTHTGKKYDGCAYDPAIDVAPWCSTKTVNGIHQAGRGEWGQCSSNCPMASGVTYSPPTPPPTISPGVAAGCDCGKAIRKGTGRIINGQATEINEYPWMAGVGRMGATAPTCGGALISDQYVMTAAHCCKGRIALNMQVSLGDHDWSIGSEANSTRHQITKIIIHPKYGIQGSLNNDVCLLKLNRPFSFSSHPNIRPICLPRLVKPASKADKYVRENGTIAGWGQTGEGTLASKYLQEIDVTVWGNKACRNVFGNGITSKMMCVSKVTNPMDSTCNGDSGGSLFYLNGQNYESIGIVSWGVKGCENNAPSVMARVSAFIKWIKDTTNDSNYCPRNKS